MRKLLLCLLLLIVLGFELRHFTGDERINANLGSAFSDSVQELRDRTVGKATAEAEAWGDRAQDSAWNTVSAFEQKVADAKQGMVDTSITAAVKMKMVNDDVAPASAIDVHTNKGVVVLTGTVNRPLEARRATELAWKAEGVRSVVSKILISEEIKNKEKTDHENNS